MKLDCATLIEQEFRSCVQNTIQRLEQEDTHRPFHRALLSDTAIFWSRFERSFSTSFGQRVIEKISKAAAFSGGASEAENQRATIVNLSTSQLNAIEDHIVSLRNHNSGRTPAWETDIRELQSIAPSPDIQKLRVISDLWWHKDGIDNFMSIKTVKPNLDQVAEAKRDLLKLKLAYPASNVYLGLYYNPFGEVRDDYSWGFTKRLFNVSSDASILIGRDYWDTLGGEGFYEQLLEIVEKIGEETRNQIGLLR